MKSLILTLIMIGSLTQVPAYAKTWVGDESDEVVKSVLSSIPEESPDQEQLKSSFVEFRSYLKSVKRKRAHKKEIIARFKETFKLWKVLECDDPSEMFFGLVGGTDWVRNPHVAIGVGGGWAAGSELIACTTQKEYGKNYGLSLSAIIGFGATVGLYVGQNGTCVRLFMGKGFLIYAGISQLSIDYDYRESGERIFRKFLNGCRTNF